VPATRDGPEKINPKSRDGFLRPNRLIFKRRKDMGANTNPTTLRAHELRQTANPAEQCLWNALKGHQLGGHKFTRQFPIGPYFADFACRQHWLLIEVDGSQHFQSEYDNRRDAFLLDEGYSILRVPGFSVLREREAVCDAILAALEGRMEDFVEASDLRFRKSHAVPRRIKRFRTFQEDVGALSLSRQAPTPNPSLAGRGK
jgi:very-short-patch-repair endonuclease